MNISQKLALFIFIAFAFVFSSCNEVADKGVDQGVVKYEITYLADKSTNPLITLLPSHLNMYFRDNSVLLSVQGWMGIFESAFIKDGKNGEVVTTLKMMNKKYYYKNIGGGFMGDSKYQNLEFVFDDSTKQIIDYHCLHAKVKVPSENIEFDIYYTNDIQITSPNLHTAFEKIPGVLMEFHMDMNGIPMHLIATELTEKEIPDSYFQIPEGYLEVEKCEIDTILSSLM